jgi:hypothetical protein
MGGQLYALAVLHSMKESLVLNGWEARWAPEPDMVVRRKIPA